MKATRETYSFLSSLYSKMRSEKAICQTIIQKDMKKKQRKMTPATTREIAAALQVLGCYNGENTEAEHEKEATRLGGGKDYYRLRLANTLLGIAETEAMLSEGASTSLEQMRHAHRQALESAGAMDTTKKLLQFLQWRTLRIEGPLRDIAQDEETGPIPVAAAHAAEALQQLLGIGADGQQPDPSTFSVPTVKADLNKARQSLTYAIENLDIMLGLFAQAEELCKQSAPQKQAAKEKPSEYDNRAQRISKLLLLDMLVPICVKKRSIDFYIPPPDFTQFIKQKGNEWGVWSMSEEELTAFEEKKMQAFTQTLTTVSPVFPLEVFSRVDRLMSVSAKV